MVQLVPLDKKNYEATHLNDRKFEVPDFYPLLKTKAAPTLQIWDFGPIGGLCVMDIVELGAVFAPSGGC
jgi:hypothetical protein